jgi:hypothetical protein
MLGTTGRGRRYGKRGTGRGTGPRHGVDTGTAWRGGEGLLRRGRARSRLRRRGTPAGAADPGRWPRLCQDAATGRGERAQALLAELRAAAGGGSRQDREAALAALLQAPPGVWLRLDRLARRDRPRPHQVGHPHVPADAEPLTLLLASFDGDGRLRQAAVERLSRRGGRYAAAALALRADDWVPAVRRPAIAALTGHVAPDEAAAAVRLLARLARRDRAGKALAAYRAALAEPERRRIVRRLAAEPDPLVRRFGVELALELGEYVRGDLARTALHDHDQVCRALCAQRLLELDPDQAGRLMWARSAAVRELAVAALPDDVPAARLVVPLADRARMVRAQARWQLYKRGEPPVEVYRKQLRRCARTTQARLVAGLATGLGECGDASDTPILCVLAADPTWAPEVRRAAVRALARVGRPEALRDVALALTADPVPSLARQALDALATIGGVPPEVLREALTRREPSVWKAALRAARTIDHWSRLELALRAAGDPRPEVAERARAEVRGWLHSFEVPARGSGRPTPPDADQLQRIGGLLQLAGLPNAQREATARVLRSVGRRPSAHHGRA